MADVLKGHGYAVTNSLAVGYTVPSSKIVTVIGMQVANIHATDAATLDVQIVRDTGTGIATYLVKGISIPVNDTLSVLDGKLVLSASDDIKFNCDANSKLEVNLSYLEQDA